MDNAALGVSGGYIFEPWKGIWQKRMANSPDSVAGGIQMFRRTCFEQIDGYTSMPFGGEDWLAELDARRAGWTVQAIPALPAYHHRPTSSADGRLRGLFRLGMMDASFGSHPLFEVLKCVRRNLGKAGLGQHPDPLWRLPSGSLPGTASQSCRRRSAATCELSRFRRLRAALNGGPGHLPDEHVPMDSDKCFELYSPVD